MCSESKYREVHRNESASAVLAMDPVPNMRPASTAHFAQSEDAPDRWAAFSQCRAASIALEPGGLSRLIRRDWQPASEKSTENMASLNGVLSRWVLARRSATETRLFRLKSRTIALARAGFRFTRETLGCNVGSLPLMVSGCNGVPVPNRSIAEAKSLQIAECPLLAGSGHSCLKPGYLSVRNDPRL